MSMSSLSLSSPMSRLNSTCDGKIRSAYGRSQYGSSAVVRCSASLSSRYTALTTGLSARADSKS